MAEILGPMKRFDPTELDRFNPAKPPRFDPESVKSQFFHEKQRNALIRIVGGLGGIGLLMAAPLLLEDTYRFLVNNPAVQQAAARAGEILQTVAR